MADEEKKEGEEGQEEETEKKPMGKGALIGGFFVVYLLSMGGLAFVMTKGDAPEGEVDEELPDVTLLAEEEMSAVVFASSQPETSRRVQFNYSIEVPSENGPAVIEAVKIWKPAIQDAILTYVEALPIDQLATPEIRSQLREKIRAIHNEILTSKVPEDQKEVIGEEPVKAVFIPSFTVR